MQRLSLILVSSLCILVLASPATGAVKIIGGTISTDTVLDTVGGSIYNATSTLTVNSGVTLTIDPGVTVKFNISTGINVNGKLLALGGATADSLIYLTSIRDDNTPPPGDDTNGDGGATVPNGEDWLPITFNDASNDSSTLKHCIIRYSGRSNTGTIVCKNASPTIENCDLIAGHYGIRCDGTSAPVIRNSSINAMDDVPIAIEITANPVLDNLAFESTSDNGFDAIGILGGTLTGPNLLGIRGATLGVTPIDNLTYILLSDITIAGGGSLTIQPGVVIKPKTSVDIFVQGALTMDGTSDPDSQIVITSFKDDNFGNPPDTNNDGSTTAPAVSNWGQIEFQTGSSGSVSWSTIKFGGYTNQGVIQCIDASPPISNCLISDCYFGIEQRGLAVSSITSNAINNSTLTPIYMSVTASPTFSGNTFLNNGLTALGLIGETLAIDSSLPIRTLAGFVNITYWLDEKLTIAQGAALTIDPGVVLKFDMTGPSIDVQGALTAAGTVDSMIVFTSERDDGAGNPADTEGNGTATTPATKNWRYIKFAATSVDTACVLDYCQLSYGGYEPGVPYRGVVWCNSAAPTITNCDFRTNGTGVRTDGSAAPVVQDNNFFNHSEIPLATSVVANPQYSGNTFDQNNYHAIGILSETLSQDATLERIQVGGPPQFANFFPYLHLGTLTINTGSVLTVQPGVIVKVLNGGTPITVNGGLSMVGTADPDSQIVYTSVLDDSKGGDSNVDGGATSPVAGNWKQILFNSTTIDSVSSLEYCLFRFGGSVQGAVRLESASPTIRLNEFEINRWGLWIDGMSNPVVDANLFRLTNITPISKSIASQPVFTNNVYDNNAYDCLGLIGETIATDLTVTKWDVAGYTNITRTLVGTTLDIDLGATLTIAPGVVLKMGKVSGGPFLSLINVDGALVAVGTVAEPIVLTSIHDDSYGNPNDTNNNGSATVPAQFDWQSITFNDVSTDSINTLEFCVITYAGWPGYAVRTISASPTIRNCTFDTNYQYGIRMEGVSNTVIDSCTFANHIIAPVVMSLLSNPSFSGNQFLSSNAYNAIGILGETLAQDVLWKRRNVAQTANIPYLLVSDLTVGLSAILRIQPGVVVKCYNTGVDIFVKRGLIAEGTADPESLIVFTSPNDDFYGGDTNNDGGATDGTNKRWGRIEIQNEAIDDSTRFDYCVIRYGTNSSTIGALQVVNANPQVSNSIFQYNGIGINYNGAAGDSTKGKVERCDFQDNTYYGVKNTGLSFTVSAKNSWWGDPTGPLDASDDTGSGGFYNPGGLGDPVTDKVDYTGYKTNGVQNFALGDVSLNGEIRAFDASLVLQHVAALITLTSQQQTIGDVTCAAGLSALDASLIQQYVAGLISFFPCATDSIATAPINVADYFKGLGQGDFRVSIPAFEVDPGGMATVPIDVSGDGDLLAHEYRIVFDPEQISIEDVRLREDAGDAILAWNVAKDGKLHIALASAEAMPIAAAVEITVRAAGMLDAGVDIPFKVDRAQLNEQDVTESATSEGGRTSGRRLPTVYRLDQNTPNPFNPSTTIHYQIPSSAGSSVRVTLTIYDVAGREIRKLVNRSDVPGIYAEVWDGRNEAGRSVSTGVYFYRLRAGSFTAVKKMLLLK